MSEGSSSFFYAILRVLGVGLSAAVCKVLSKTVIKNVTIDPVALATVALLIGIIWWIFGSIRDEKNAAIQGLYGLRSWLILPGLMIVINVLARLYNIRENFTVFFEWREVTDFGLLLLREKVEPLLIGETLVLIVFVLVWLYIAKLYFTKNKVFPVWFLGTLIANNVFGMIYYFIVYQFLQFGDVVLQRQHGWVLIITLIITVIFLIAFTNSKRVKATFIYPMEKAEGAESSQS